MTNNERLQSVIFLIAEGRMMLHPIGKKPADCPVLLGKSPFKKGKSQSAEFRKLAGKGKAALACWLDCQLACEARQDMQDKVRKFFQRFKHSTKEKP